MIRRSKAERAPARRVYPLALLAVSAGCGGDFTPYNRLDKLRVLALAGDPVNPAPGESTELSALIYTPDPDATASVTYEWSWCPFPGPASEGYPCLVTEDDLARLGGAGATFDLGAGSTASLPHIVDPTVLRDLCRGAPGAPRLPDCAGGFPVQARLRVSAGRESVVAVHDVRLRFDPSHEANTNPVIEGLAADLPSGRQAITGQPLVTLSRNEETLLYAAVPETAAESYTVLDDAGRPMTARERVFLTWFVESGVTDSERTSFIDGIVPLERTTQNRWKPGKVKDYAASTARLFVVIRDNRGGAAWRDGIVTLGSAP